MTTFSTDTIINARYSEIPRAGVIINEIGYRVDDGLSHNDWVELYNPTDTPIDLSDFRMTDGTDATAGYSSITFPLDTVIQPHSYIVYANSRDTFFNRYGIEPVVSKNGGTLNLGHTESGKTYGMALFDNYGRLIEESPKWTRNGDLVSGGRASKEQQNICRIDGVWKNTCQQTPNAINSENAPTVTLSAHTIVHNATNTEIGTLGNTGNNGIDKTFTCSKAATTASKYSNDLFEITADNKLKYIGTNPTDFFTKNSYTILVEVK